MFKKEFAEIEEIMKKGEKIRNEYMKGDPRPTKISIKDLDEFSDGDFSKLKFKFDEVNDEINKKLSQQNCFEQKQLDDFLQQFYKIINNNEDDSH